MSNASRKIEVRMPVWLALREIAASFGALADESPNGVKFTRRELEYHKELFEVLAKHSRAMSNHLSALQSGSPAPASAGGETEADNIIPFPARREQRG